LNHTRQTPACIFNARRESYHPYGPVHVDD
jgi:hypothetical protein